MPQKDMEPSLLPIQNTKYQSIKGFPIVIINV